MAEYGLDGFGYYLLHLHSYASVQAAIATLYDEVVIVKNALDNVAKERNKLRSDIQVNISIRKIGRRLQSMIRKHRKEPKF